MSTTTKSAQHTEGPWEVVIGKSVAWSPNAICLIEMSPDRQITVAAVNRERVSSGAREDDARLIAAAPELLEALERIDKVLCNNSEITDNNVVYWFDRYSPETDDAVQQLRAAIRKAKREGKRMTRATVYLAAIAWMILNALLALEALKK